MRERNDGHFGNLRWLYAAIDKYMRTRLTARREFLARMVDLEHYRGSSYYDEKREEAEEKRAKTIEAAQNEAFRETNAALRRMDDEAGHIGLVVPTQEQYALLDYLRQRKQLSQSEVDWAANTLGDNALALNLLREIAVERGVKNPMINYSRVAPTLSIEQAHETIDNLSEVVREIIDDTTGADAVSLKTKRWHSIRYGSEYDPDNLPEQRLYTSEEDFFNSVTSTSYEALRAAVD